MKGCQTGCQNFTGGEIHHHKDCQYYEDSLSEELDGYREQAKNLHKPLVTSSYDAEDMKEAYEYGKGYGTGNFDEWLKNYCT